MKRIILAYLISISILNATGAWMMSQRTHGELKWSTISTNHFDIHYHQGIRDIALKGASIAEQIRPTLIEQMGLDTLPRLDITLTTEDEVLNGFATSGNYTIIWVDQNDAALWNGDEKWLRTVLAHELQHLVYFNTVKGPWWLPEPMNQGLAGVPAWIVEGIAEYYTEKWRPFRYDISHKGHVIRNTVHKIRDPHNDGFSKTLYLADRFGDSTISKIFNHRNKAGYLDFKESFKKHTGISVKQFNEDWRRQMNTFFFGHRSQKEKLEDIGRVHKLPMKRVSAFDYFTDTTRVAMIGRLSKGQRDLSLVVATRDTAKEKKLWEKRVKKAEEKNEKPKKVRAKWKLKELDHGIFGEMNMNLDVSPDNTFIVYPKYRYGKDQSLLYDIWKINVETKKKTLLTNSMRANYPKFSPDGRSILFVAHERSTTQLYTMDINGENIKQITSNTGDVQIITPVWSPDGKSIAYAESGPDGEMDIHILEIYSGESKQITNSAEADFLPIWHPDGSKISFTGLYDYTPNLYTNDLTSGNTVQNTDIGDMVMGLQWDEQTSTITAKTLPTVDSSRVVAIDPARVANKTKVNMNPAFSSWRTKSPDKPINEINPNYELNIRSEGKYRFHKKMRHVGSIFFPDVEGLLYNGAFTDALGRHTIAGALFTDYSSITNLYVQYQNSTGFLTGGFWGFDIYSNSNFQLQLYDEGETLLELFNGVSFWGKTLHNFGNSLSANHSLIYSLQLVERDVYDNEIEFSSRVFPSPDEGNEGSINLTYLFLNKRAHSRNMLLPNQGYGLEIKLKNANSSIWGVFDYTKTEFDFFMNKKLGPFALYGRGRYEMMIGTPPSQETLGIVDLRNYYFTGATTPGREYMSPRGFTGAPRLGEKAFMSTFELRAPVLPISIFELLKSIKIGMPTFALISDMGNAWSNNSPQEMIITTGYEWRASINIGNEPLLIFSYGWAQEQEKWSEGIQPEPYFQTTLINPF